MEKRFCKICHKKIPETMGYRAVTCGSKECLLQVKRTRQTQTKVCPQCHKEFQTKTAKSIYCSRYCKNVARYLAGKDRAPKKCERCGRMFFSRPGSSRTLCQDCFTDKSRLQKEELDKKLAKFEGQESITCRICNTLFLSGEITGKHLKKHNLTPSQYKEQFGEDSLWSSTRRQVKLEQLNRARQQRVKTSTSQTRTCAYCGKPLSPNQSKRVNTCSRACGYALRKQKTAERIKYCKVCNKPIDFGVRDRRSRTCSVECERAAIGMRKPTLRVCQSCGKTFESRASKAYACLECQSKLHQLKQGRVVKICSKCGREFLSTSESNDLCKTCFRNKDRQEEKVKAKFAGIEPIQCRICGKVFAGGLLTNTHLKLHNITQAQYKAKFESEGQHVLYSSSRHLRQNQQLQKVNPQFDDTHIKAREEALRKYEELQPKCAFCHKLLPLKKFMQYFSQKKQGNKWEDKPRFCSTKCRGSYYISDEFHKIAPHKYLRPRSKNEKAIEQWLRTNFPTLELITNDRTQLKPYELDIYIPQYRMGIEYEGPLHYEPIFGEKRFHKVLETDAKKVALAAEKGISLIIIDGRIKSFEEQIAPLKAALASVLPPS
jgi:hypothetical protein